MPFLNILLDIIAPIFVLISLGYLFQKKWHFDMQALTRVLLYLVMPATLVVSLTQSELSADFVWDTSVFCLLMLVALYVLSLAGSLVMRYQKDMKQAFSLSVMYYNSGNYGFPASELAFPTLGLAVQSIVLAVQNFLVFTLGLFFVSVGRISARRAFLQSFKMPFVYALILAFAIRNFGLQLPGFVWLPIEYLAEALVPMALVTLGMQLARTRITQAWQASLASLVCRLVISPLIGYGLVLLLDIDPRIAPILIVSTSYPTAINTVLIDLEFGSREDFAANAVFLSTVCSIVTVAVVIFLVR
ncbi:MAG: AEC family transporter [Gemmatimonadetes bacterium]|nr:AEC family transporter [Gemmatimonadota bacterium]MYK98547.1 AEC family transporter [Gemmatimonadota bacterium]